MTEWKWKIGESIERLRTRYDHIGRKTAAPFLAMVYPCAVERAFVQEWRSQVAGLAPEVEAQSLDLLEVTQAVVAEFGVDAVVQSLVEPMPGSNAEAELAGLWLRAIADRVRSLFAAAHRGKPVVWLENCAALYPACGPRDVMQALWDAPHEALQGPVVVLIPGTLEEARTYRFLDQRRELMYRGDLL